MAGKAEVIISLIMVWTSALCSAATLGGNTVYLGGGEMRAPDAVGPEPRVDDDDDGDEPCAEEALIPPEIPDFCLQEKAVGPCRALLASYHYDADAGECRPFGYGGCCGNANRFAAAEDCAAFCVARTATPAERRDHLAATEEGIPSVRAACERMSARITMLMKDGRRAFRLLGRRDK